MIKALKNKHLQLILAQVGIADNKTADRLVNNERADQLDKKGADTPFTGPEPV